MILLPVLLFLASILFPSYSAEQRLSFDSLSTEHEEIQREIVDKHNVLRANVFPSASNMLKMQWLKEAGETAQKWANRCTFKHSEEKDRDIDGTCGENLFMSSAPFSWSKAIQFWYDEVNHFEFGKGSTTKEAVGHYTQVVSYNSYGIGCGFANCSGSYYNYFYVCHYCPGGNIVSRLNSPYEIGRPCAKCPNSCSNNLCTNPCKHKNLISNCSQLLKNFSCNHSLLQLNCKATCLCPNQII
ncbi:cysteine-rich secretory protein 3-like [Macrotis lagotis]|uniref:cysteine-rich secretory protein 3-like n=1 Tax=Macrotis lagotis TaxID=92651 RepID=UPI003D691E61